MKQQEEAKPLIKSKNYKFNFSTERELAGGISCCRLIIIILLVLVSLTLPVISLIDYLGLNPLNTPDKQFNIPIYAWAVYILVINTIVLMLMSRLLASSISYPFSNSCFRRSMRRSNNQRFGIEFRKSIERMTEFISSVIDRQNHDYSAAIFNDEGEGFASKEFDTSMSETHSMLSSKDIYLKLAQQMELINLYNEIN